MSDTQDTGGEVETLADAQYRSYVYDRRKLRRRMAVTAFAWFLLTGTCVIAAGLASSEIAARIAQIGIIVSTFLGTLAAIVGWYWGVGAMEHNAETSSAGGYWPRTSAPVAQKSSREG
jgi:hypothetical protein